LTEGKGAPCPGGGSSSSDDKYPLQERAVASIEIFPRDERTLYQGSGKVSPGQGGQRKAQEGVEIQMYRKEKVFKPDRPRKTQILGAAKHLRKGIEKN